MRSPKKAMVDWIVRVVTRHRKSYHSYGFNDPEKLKRHLRKGDVILIDGDQRVSQAIKTLTMSSWSHNCVYIGDELLKSRHPLKTEVEKKFGREAPYLVIEALVEKGVIVSPVLKYLDFNIRVCRPHGLTPEDLQVVLDNLISKIGLRYDIKNVIDLTRYILPFHLVPARFREDALHLGSGLATETICSSMTAEAFAKVKFPILPEYRPARPRTPAEKLKAAILGRKSRRAYTGLFRARHPTLVVPRDFDLSPFFEIIKFNVIEDGSFDYKKIRWAKEPASRSAR